jgi:DNA repair exonuclease SbcCD ATPase subunit
MEMDKKKKAGNELNEVEAHHFLQSSGKTMTALELRNELRKIDVDANGMMGLLEYLLFQYRRRVTDCLNNAQGGSEESKALAAAQVKLEELQKAAADLQVQLAQQREDEAKAKAAHASLVVAEEEARAASAEFQRQEDEYKAKIAALEAKTQDANLGTVSRNKAVQELAQLKGADPLPLRRAKITQEAAVRKVEAERKVADAARLKSEEQTRKVEAAVADCEAKVAETQAILEELKKASTVPHGAIWWMQREILEAQKYMPRSKQTGIVT